MVIVAYNAYCVISKEGENDTYDGKTVGRRSWEVDRSYREFSCGDAFSHENNMDGNWFNISFTTGIHNLLHEFREPWPNRAILEPMVYGTVL